MPADSIIKFMSTNALAAFSDENDGYRDSSMYMGSIVEHTNSWLTINPYKGCSLKCAYCFRAKWGASDTPLLETDVETAVEQLVAHPDFLPHITPVSINISSTDALLPVAQGSTFRAIQLLESKRLRNPFGLTTKLSLAQSRLEFLESLQFVRPIVFVSLAMIPRNIEPIPVKPRIRTLQSLSKSKIPCVHYFRPIVEGWNDSEATIRAVLDIGNDYADAICIGSLRLSPEIRHELQRINVHLPGDTNHFHKKTLGGGIEERILEAYSQIGATVPMFKHTSCAVSYLMDISNYNQLYRSPARNCLPSCPAHQQRLCNSCDPGASKP